MKAIVDKFTVGNNWVGNCNVGNFNIPAVKYLSDCR